jgi:hypothetical protein
MKKLSNETVSTIITALIAQRIEAVADVDYWNERVGQARARSDAKVYQALAQKKFDRNASAIDELSKSIAPWIIHMPMANPALRQPALPLQTTTQEPA